MHTFTADIQQKLRNIAATMRMVLVWTHEVHLMTKEEMEEMGHVDAEKLEDGMYAVKMPVQIAKNHYRALKKNFKRTGWDGCRSYIMKINALENE
jgi:hydrogenase maturation factor HypF (carbamoyltransferase family)